MSTNHESKTTKEKVHDPESHEEKILKNPLAIMKVKLSEDFYAVTWTCFRKSVWLDKKIRGVQISPTGTNYFWLQMNFLLFCTIVLVTICLLFWEAFSTITYIDANWVIVILRICLLGFAQKKLSPEFYKGETKLRYTYKNWDDFEYPLFAMFVAFCQLFVSCITFICIILFLCMSDQAFKLIMHFAELAVLTELDDWLGEKISQHKPHHAHSEEPNDMYNLEGINENMGLMTKMSMVKDDLEITDDQTAEFEGFYFKILNTIFNNVPWELLPLITIPANKIMLYLRPRLM